MFRTYIRNPIRKHWQTMILGCLIAAGLASGIVLVILQVTQTKPPDPATAEVKQIGEFLSSEKFLEMPNKQRTEFIDRVIHRQIRMTPQQREQARQTLKSFNLSKSADREMWRATMLAWGVKRADEYAKLPPEQKDAYIDRWIGIMEILRGKERTQRAHRGMENRANGRSAGKATSKKFQNRAKHFLKNTNAEDRAKLSRLTGGVMRRIKQRHDQQ